MNFLPLNAGATRDKGIALKRPAKLCAKRKTKRTGVKAILKLLRMTRAGG
jgi:hypothetical protein